MTSLAEEMRVSTTVGQQRLQDVLTDIPDSVEQPVVYLQPAEH